MHSLAVSTDIIPVGELKKRLSQYLASVNGTGHPLVITQNGKPAGVLISPAEYDYLVEQRLFVESVSRGLKDARSGKVRDTADLQVELKKRRAFRSS